MLSSVGLLIRIVLNAVAVWVATLIFGLVNAVIKPVVKLLSLPLLILTLGLFALVINALLFWLTAVVSKGLGAPFEVGGFWSAFWGAIVVGLVSWALSLAVPDPGD